MKKAKKAAWGGARPGAGTKKPREKTLFLQMRISPAEREKLDKMRGDKSLSAYVRERLGLDT